MIVCILGRQPAIGLAELEALYGADKVRPVGSTAALVDVEKVDFARLGSTIKAGLVHEVIPGTNPQKVFLWLQKNIAALVGLVEGKLKLGVSLYELPMPVSKLNANTLSLKKALRAGGLSVRIVPNTEPALSSAQSYHNNLAVERGCEVLLVRDGENTIVARLTNVQNIDAYRIRDRERPKRDAFVGMLPPKLAQTIVNLATGPKTSGIVLDPFCGTGVVLQESLLMGFTAYGTDLVQRMVDFSQINLEWLRSCAQFRLEQGDATDHVWRQPIDAVACEGYLGQPLGGQDPTAERLRKIIADCDTVARGFLKNIGSQLEPGTPLCLALPAWFAGGKTYHLPALDDLEKLGYTRIDFVHANRDDLIYHREDQVVGRELVVLRSK